MSASRIPERSPLSETHHISLPAQIKRAAPWTDIGLVTTAVALVAIGGLAHFGVLNHIGTLSQTTIQYAAFGGAGGVLFIEAAQRITRNCLRKPIEPIDFSTIKPIPYTSEGSYQGKKYSVKGMIPEALQDNVAQAVEEGLKKQDRGEGFLSTELDRLLASADGEITVQVGEDIRFQGKYEDGWRVRYEQEGPPPLKILGDFPPALDPKDIAQRLSEGEQSKEQILEALDEIFMQAYATGSIQVDFGKENTLTAHYENGKIQYFEEKIRHELESVLIEDAANLFSGEYKISGIGIIEFENIPLSVLENKNFYFSSDEAPDAETILLKLDFAFHEEKESGSVAFRIPGQKAVTATYLNGERQIKRWFH